MKASKVRQDNYFCARYNFLRFLEKELARKLGSVHRSMLSLTMDPVRGLFREEKINIEKKLILCK